MNIIRKTIALFILASCCVLSMSGCAALAIYYAYESSHNDNLEKYKELQTLRCDKYDNVEYEDIKYYDSGIDSVDYCYEFGKSAVGKVIYAEPIYNYEPMFIIEQNDFDYNIMEFKGRIYLADGKTFPKITDLSIKEIIITDYQDSEKRATLLRFDSSDNVKIFDLVEENSKISMDTEGINELYKIKCALDDYDSFSLGEYIIAEYNGKLYLRINSIGYFEIASYYSDLFYI